MADKQDLAAAPPPPPGDEAPGATLVPPPPTAGPSVGTRRSATATASKDNDNNTKRRRIARQITPDLKERVVQAHKKVLANRDKKGKTNDHVAKEFNMGASTVATIIKEYRHLVEAARAKGIDEKDVKFPEFKKEKRNRPRKLKDSHISYIEGCLLQMMSEEADTRDMPTIRAMYEYSTKDTMLAEYAAAKKIAKEDVFPFKLTTFFDVIRELGYSHDNSVCDRIKFKELLVERSKKKQS